LNELRAAKREGFGGKPDTSLLLDW
jgi:hypothetical protein